MGLYQQLETPKNYSPILSKWILIRAQNNTLLVSGSNRVGCPGARRWLHKGHDSWASRAPCMILLALTLDACHEVLATPQTFTEIFTCTVLFFRTCTVLVLFSLFCPDFCSSSICWCAQWTSTSSWSPAPTPPDHMRAVLGYSTPLQLTRASQQSQLPGSQYQPALSFSFILEKGPFFQTIQLYHDWLVNWLSVKKFIFGHI